MAATATDTVIPAARRDDAPLLVMEDIHVAFGGTIALDRESFALRPGEIVGLLGHNGAGKSTLVNVATGAIRPQRGRMTVAGEPLSLRGDPREMEHAGIKVIHQQPALADNLSIADNITLGRPEASQSRAQRRAFAVQALALLGATLNVDRPVGSLEFGEKQLVDLARALSTQLRVLFLDEPTGALGQHEADRLHNLLRKLAADGRGVVYVSHRLRDILSVCTRLVVLQGGKVVFDRPAAGIGLAELSNALAPGLKNRERASSIAGKPVGLSARWKGLDLKFPKGTITGLFGMAAGPQFRFLESAYGLWGPQELTVEGSNVTVASPRDSVREGVYFVSANRDQDGLVPEMTAVDNLLLPWLSKHRAGPFVSPSRALETFRRAAQALNIRGGGPQTPVGAFSGGNRQKVFLGRWLYGTPPKAVLLSQPTQGVDVGARTDIAIALQKMADTGITILVASSEADEIELLCSRSYVCHGNDWEMSEAGDGWSEKLLEILIGNM